MKNIVSLKSSYQLTIPKITFYEDMALHRALGPLNYCPLKAGHAIKTSQMSNLLPNFIMLLDTLTNTYLGLRKSKSGDKAETISRINSKI